jgi:hypothetical protein
LTCTKPEKARTRMFATVWGGLWNEAHP